MISANGSPYDSKPPPALTSCVWNKVSFVWNKEDWKAATGFNFLRLEQGFLCLEQVLMDGGRKIERVKKRYGSKSAF